MDINVESREALISLRMQNSKKVEELTSSLVSDIAFVPLDLEEIVSLYEEGLFDRELKDLDEEDRRDLEQDVSFYVSILGDDIFKLSVQKTRERLLKKIEKINNDIEDRVNRIRESNRVINDELRSIQRVISFVDSLITIYDSDRISESDVQKVYDSLKEMPLDDGELASIIGQTSLAIIEARKAKTKIKAKEKDALFEKFDSQVGENDQLIDGKVPNDVKLQFEEAVLGIKEYFGKEEQANIRYIADTKFPIEAIDVRSISDIQDICLYISSLIDIINGSDEILRDRANLLLKEIQNFFSVAYQKNLRDKLDAKVCELKDAYQKVNSKTNSFDLNRVKDVLEKKKNMLLKNIGNSELDDVQESIDGIFNTIKLIEDTIDIPTLIADDISFINSMAAQYADRTFLLESDLVDIVEKIDSVLKQIREYSYEYEKNCQEILDNVKKYTPKEEHETEKRVLVDIKGFLLFDGVFRNGDFMPYIVSDLEVDGKNAIIDSGTLGNPKMNLDGEFHNMINDFFGGIIKNGYSDFALANQDGQYSSKATDYVYYDIKGKVHDGKKMSVRRLKNSGNGDCRITEKMFRVNGSSRLYDELSKLFNDYGARMDPDGINLYAVFASGIKKLDSDVYDATIKRCGTKTATKEEGYNSYLYKLLSAACSSPLNTTPPLNMASLSSEERTYLEELLERVKDMVNESFKAYEILQQINADKVSPDSLRCDVIEQMLENKERGLN